MSADPHSVIASRLATCRRCAGLTQRQLSQQAGIPRGRLSDYEHGNRPVLAVDLHRLARALDRRIDWFFTGGELF